MSYKYITNTRVLLNINENLLHYHYYVCQMWTHYGRGHDDR